MLAARASRGGLRARHLVDAGIGALWVTNRTWVRAVELARTFGGRPVPFDQFGRALADADIVVTSTGAPEPIIRRPMIDEALRRRAPRPLFLIDLGVPRDVEQGLGALPNVFVYDLDDLARVAQANLAERQREAARAEALVAREAAARFLGELREREVGPIIAGIRARLEAIRQAEVARTTARLPRAEPETLRALEALSTSTVNKILHTPLVRLRERARDAPVAPWIGLVSELFGLDEAFVDPPAREVTAWAERWEEDRP